MTKRRVIAAALSLIFIAAFVASCDDDDDSTTLYLDGTIAFDLDSYIAQNTTIEFEASGISHPEGGEITFIWSVECDDWDDDDDEVCDTVDVFTYTFGEDLTTYTVTCKAKADDYSTSTTSLTTTVVKGGLDGTGSLTDSLGSAVLNLSLVATITDSREEDDVKDYYYTTIGGYDWFIQNLAYLGSDLSEPIGTPYCGYKATLDVFGAFYSYDEALVACPDGWSLPSADEWDACIPETSGDLMANVYFNGSKMWEFWPVVKISNNSLFSAVPAGQANLVSNTFTGIEERAVFWTSTESEDDNTTAVVKYFLPDQSNVYEAYLDKESFGASVRCVRQSKSSIEY